MIDYYKIDEIGSNYIPTVYNPHSIVTNPDEYYDGIARKQTELLYIYQDKQKKLLDEQKKKNEKAMQIEKQKESQTKKKTYWDSTTKDQ